jgi:hypothetical protein
VVEKSIKLENKFFVKIIVLEQSSIKKNGRKTNLKTTLQHLQQ